LRKYPAELMRTRMTNAITIRMRQPAKGERGASFGA